MWTINPYEILRIFIHDFTIFANTKSMHTAFLQKYKNLHSEVLGVIITFEVLGYIKKKLYGHTFSLIDLKWFIFMPLMRRVHIKFLPWKAFLKIGESVHVYVTRVCVYTCISVQVVCKFLQGTIELNFI